MFELQSRHIVCLLYACLIVLREYVFDVHYLELVVIVLVIVRRCIRSVMG